MHAALLLRGSRKFALGRTEVTDSYAGKFMALTSFAFGYLTVSVTPARR